MRCLRSKSILPPCSIFATDPDIEASALRALDLIDENRIVAVFHADDPVFLASSAGEMQRTMELVSKWSVCHGASLHVTPKKTIVSRVGESVG